MKRPLSQLIYARIRETDSSPTIVTLHQRGLFGRSAAEYGLAASSVGRVLSLESYKGVYVGRSIVGYTWFVGPDDRPSPLFFGDALAEIERFLWDEIDRQDSDRAELPFLLGVEQGGIMAIAAAAAVPDLLSGVIVVDGFLPIVPGWEPPLAPLAGLPVLLLETPDQPTPEKVLHGATLADTLEQWGATVVRQSVPSAKIPAEEMARWLEEQTVRFHQTAE